MPLDDLLKAIRLGNDPSLTQRTVNTQKGAEEGAIKAAVAKRTGLDALLKQRLANIGSRGNALIGQQIAPNASPTDIRKSLNISRILGNNKIASGILGERAESGIAPIDQPGDTIRDTLNLDQPFTGIIPPKTRAAAAGTQGLRTIKGKKQKNIRPRTKNDPPGVGANIPEEYTESREEFQKTPIGLDQLPLTPGEQYRARQKGNQQPKLPKLPSTQKKVGKAPKQASKKPEGKVVQKDHPGTGLSGFWWVTPDGKARYLGERAPGG